MFASRGYCNVVLTMPRAVVQTAKLPDCIPGALVSFPYSLFFISGYRWPSWGVTSPLGASWSCVNTPC